MPESELPIGPESEWERLRGHATLADVVARWGLFLPNGRTVVAPPEGMQPVTCRPPDGHRDVQHDAENLPLFDGQVGRVNLGPSPLFADLVGGSIELVADLNRTWVPQMSKRRMRELLFPLWTPRRRFSFTQAANHIDMQMQPAPGLFWTSPTRGYFQAALETAIALLYDYADFAVALPIGDMQCGGFGWTRDSIREFIDNELLVEVPDPPSGLCALYRVTLVVEQQGRVTAHREPLVRPKNPFEEPTGVSAKYHSSGRITFCSRNRMQAALADYWFWWAWRLLDYGFRCQSSWHVLIAILCGRSAMSEIVRLAATIMHEIGHHGGMAEHCSNRLTGAGRNCCQSLMQKTFTHMMSAEWGLVLDRLAHGEGSYKSRLDQVSWRNRSEGSVRCDYSWVEGWHCSTVGERHPVQISWFNSPACRSADALGSGAIRLNEEQDDCIVPD